MRVFVQGSYDIINAGHVRSLKELKEKFGYVIVGLNSSRLMLEHKGREIIPFAQRKEILESLKYVDEVIECDSPMALKYLKEVKADVFATVQEWTDRQSEAMDYCETYILPYFPEDGETLSSTMIRQRVRGSQ
jgi:cytidyltransferase-like protein